MSLARTIKRGRTRGIRGDEFGVSAMIDPRVLGRRVVGDEDRRCGNLRCLSTVDDSGLGGGR